MFQTAYLNGSKILLIAVYGDEAWIEEDCKRRMVSIHELTYSKEQNENKH